MPRVTGPGVAAPRWTTYIRLSDLRPAVRNPKAHVIGDIVTSIQTFGFTNPVLMCDRADRLAAGHGRMAALVNMKEHGDPMPNGLVMDDDGEWCVPATRGWRTKNDAELEAYIIADNALTEAGGWNDGMLAEMLHDVHSFDPALFEATGIDAERMEDLMRRWNGEDSGTGGLDLGGDDSAGEKPRPPSVTCPHCGESFTPKGT
jgi:hypothetical protein